MRNVCFKKALVVGIIVLFLGVGVYPAVAGESIISERSLESVESRMHPLLKRYMVRHQETLKEIEVFMESNPELKDRIEQLKDSDCDCVKDTTTDWDYPVLCVYLHILFWFAVLLWALNINGELMFIIGDIGKALNCYWPSP